MAVALINAYSLCGPIKSFLIEPTAMRSPYLRLLYDTPKPPTFKRWIPKAENGVMRIRFTVTPTR